jgi:hypothetical protein
VSPALPLNPGPKAPAITYSFPPPVGGSQPITIAYGSTLNTAVTALNATLSLTFNGVPGFPLTPQAGTYEAIVAMTDQNGNGVLCADFTVPNAAFVRVDPPAIPTAALPALALLALAVALGGWLLLAHRS